MCLTIPKKILSISQKSIIGQSPKGKREKITASLIKIKNGDWVLTQNSIVVKKITSKQAGQINALLSS